MVAVIHEDIPILWAGFPWAIQKPRLLLSPGSVLPGGWGVSGPGQEVAPLNSVHNPLT